MNDLMRQVGKQLADKRARNSAITLERKREIYDAIPKIKAIDIEMASIVKEVIGALADAPNSAIDASQQAANMSKLLTQKKRQLLRDNNFPADYLDPIYDCAICHDEGYLDDGKRCQCFASALLSLAYQNSDLRAKLNKENFDTFKLNLFSDQIEEDESLSQRQNMANNVESAMGFIANFDDNNQENLLFYGNTGQGKTFLCSCIAKALIDQGKQVVYQTAYKLFEAIGNYRFASDDAAKMRYQLLSQCDLLIIDDLGTELMNTFTHSELFNLINMRLLEQKKTIISTNLSPQELSEQYGDRIISRIIGHYRIMRFFGEDLRFK